MGHSRLQHIFEHCFQYICFYVCHLFSITECMYVCLIRKYVSFNCIFVTFSGTRPCVCPIRYVFWSVSVSLCVSPAFEHCLLLWKALYQPARSAETLCSTQKISDSFVSNIMFSLGLYCTQRLVLHLNLITRRVHRLLKTSY